MSRNENSPSLSHRKQRPVEDYDKRCVEIAGVDEMSVEELTQVIVDLYGQIPPPPASSPPSGDDRDLI